jgi:hypothetical protein
MHSVFHSFFSTLRGFLILLIVSITLGVGYALFSLQQMNVEARSFINTTMLSLFVDWNNDDFMTYTSRELRKNLTPKQLENINIVFIRLGQLLNYHGAQGGVFRSPRAWWELVARYKVRASFQGGQFVAVVTLIKQQGNWVIGRFEYQYAFFPKEPHHGSLKMVLNH